MAYETLIQVSVDERMRSKIRSQEIAKRDYITRLHTAERVGKIQGIAQGIKGFISVMLDFNMPQEAILSKRQEEYGFSELETLELLQQI